MKKRIISLLITTLMIMSVITIPSYAEAEDKIYGNYLFNESTLPKGLSLRNSYDCVDIENSVLKLWYKSTLTASAAYLNIDKITPVTTTLPELVVEYQSKTNGSSTTSYMSDNGTKLVTYYYNGFNSINDVGWEAKAGTNFGTIDDVTQWHTYAVKYSNKDNTRSLYVDGELIGTTEDVDGNNPWFKNNNASFTFKLHDTKKNSSAEFEYIKTYSPASDFSAEVLDSEATDLNELILDFNGIPMNVSESNIKVNGKNPASVTPYDEAEQQYKVTLAETLKPETKYEVSLNGISNTIGQTTYDVLPFTTRALKDNEVYFDISDSGVVRTVERTGEEKVSTKVTNGTFTEAESLELTVKPNKGYEAVVTVNGEPVNETSYGSYNITVTDGAYIDIDFTAIADATAPTVSTASRAFVDGDTSYIFARISKPIDNDKFGVIVSKDKAIPTIEDVDDKTTFKLSATEGSNLYGEYGIAITDRAEGNVLGNTYYVRPYATFGETVVYGAVVPVTVTTVQ